MVDERGLLEERIAAAREGLSDAASALLFVRPDRAREAAERGLRAARLQLDGANRVLESGDRVRDTATPSAARRYARLLPIEVDDDVHRRIMLKLLSFLGGAAAAPGTALARLRELEETVNHEGPVDGLRIDAFRTVTNAYAQEFITVPPQQLIDVLRAHVNRTVSCMELPTLPSLRARLGTVVAETAALTGWVLHVAGQRGEAHAYFTLARDVAREVGDATAEAVALASMSSLYSTKNRGSEGGSQAALRLLQQAAELVPHGAPTPAKAWINARVAEESAALGDTGAFAVSLEHALTIRANERRDDPLGSLVFMEQGLMNFWGQQGEGPSLSEGFGLSVLGDRRGVDRLTPLLHRVDNLPSRAVLLGDLVTAHVNNGDHDQAVRRAAQMVEVTVASGVLGRLERVRGLRRRMPDGVPGLADLDELLAAV